MVLPTVTMPELTQLERALRILQRLMTHEGLSVRQLHELFDGQEPIRTIQRTLEAIQAANIPLAFTTGPHGERFYSLKRAFDFIPLNLNPDELLAALLLAQFGEVFTGTRIGRDIAGVMEKLDQLVPPGSVTITSTLSGAVDAFQLHQPGLVEFEAGEAALGMLFKAIIEHRVIWIKYRRAGEERISHFDLHPYSLLFHTGAIYAVGWQPYYRNWIHLAAHRVQEVELTDESFTRDPAFHLDEFLKDHFGIWQQEPVDVMIRFDATVAPSIRERRWHPSQKLRELDDGGIELRMRVGPSYELIAWILRWGRFAEVTKPKELRQAVHFQLSKALEKYQPI